MAERRGPLGPAIPKMTYHIQAVVLVVELVQQLLNLVEHGAAHRLVTRGKPILGVRPNRLPQYWPKTEALPRHLHGSLGNLQPSSHAARD
jgi:hypothetical protein